MKIGDDVLRPEAKRLREKADAIAHLAELLRQGGALAEPFSIGPELAEKIENYKAMIWPRETERQQS
jgi:hypothetical protein